MKGHHCKLDCIRHLLSFDDSLAALGISETKLSNKVDDSEIRLKGYETFRKDRGKNEGGAVLIYCLKSLNPRFTSDIHIPNIEFVAIKVTLSLQDSCILCCVYRTGILVRA